MLGVSCQDGRSQRQLGRCAAANRSLPVRRPPVLRQGTTLTFPLGDRPGSFKPILGIAIPSRNIEKHRGYRDLPPWVGGLDEDVSVVTTSVEPGGFPTFGPRDHNLVDLVGDQRGILCQIED